MTFPHPINPPQYSYGPDLPRSGGLNGATMAAGGSPMPEQGGPGEKGGPPAQPAPQPAPQPQQDDNKGGAD